MSLNVNAVAWRPPVSPPMDPEPSPVQAPAAPTLSMHASTSSAPAAASSTSSPAEPVRAFSVACSGSSAAGIFTPVSLPPPGTDPASAWGSLSTACREGAQQHPLTTQGFVALAPTIKADGVAPVSLVEDAQVAAALAKCPGILLPLYDGSDSAEWTALASVMRYFSSPNAAGAAHAPCTGEDPLVVAISFFTLHKAEYGVLLLRPGVREATCRAVEQRARDAVQCMRAVAVPSLLPVVLQGPASASPRACIITLVPMTADDVAAHDRAAEAEAEADTTAGLDTAASFAGVAARLAAPPSSAGSAVAELEKALLDSVTGNHVLKGTRHVQRVRLSTHNASMARSVAAGLAAASTAAGPKAVIVEVPVAPVGCHAAATAATADAARRVPVAPLQTEQERVRFAVNVCHGLCLFPTVAVDCRPGSESVAAAFFDKAATNVFTSPTGTTAAAAAVWTTAAQSVTAGAGVESIRYVDVATTPALPPFWEPLPLVEDLAALQRLVAAAVPAAAEIIRDVEAPRRLSRAQLATAVLQPQNERLASHRARGPRCLVVAVPDQHRIYLADDALRTACVLPPLAWTGQNPPGTGVSVLRGTLATTGIGAQWKVLVDDVWCWGGEALVGRGVAPVRRADRMRRVETALDSERAYNFRSPHNVAVVRQSFVPLADAPLALRLAPIPTGSARPTGVAVPWTPDYDRAGVQLVSAGPIDDAVLDAAQQPDEAAPELKPEESAQPQPPSRATVQPLVWQPPESVAATFVAGSVQVVEGDSAPTTPPVAPSEVPQIPASAFSNEAMPQALDPVTTNAAAAAAGLTSATQRQTTRRIALFAVDADSDASVRAAGPAAADASPLLHAATPFYDEFVDVFADMAPRGTGVGDVVQCLLQRDPDGAHWWDVLRVFRPLAFDIMCAPALTNAPALWGPHHASGVPQGGEPDAVTTFARRFGSGALTPRAEIEALVHDPMVAAQDLLFLLRGTGDCLNCGAHGQAAQLEPMSGRIYCTPCWNGFTSRTTFEVPPPSCAATFVLSALDATGPALLPADQGPRGATARDTDRSGALKAAQDLTAGSPFPAAVRGATRVAHAQLIRELAAAGPCERVVELCLGSTPSFGLWKTLNPRTRFYVGTDATGTAVQAADGVLQAAGGPPFSTVTCADSFAPDMWNAHLARWLPEGTGGAIHTATCLKPFAVAATFGEGPQRCAEFFAYAAGCIVPHGLLAIAVIDPEAARGPDGAHSAAAKKKLSPKKGQVTFTVDEAKGDARRSQVSLYPRTVDTFTATTAAAMYDLPEVPTTEVVAAAEGSGFTLDDGLTSNMAALFNRAVASPPVAAGGVEADQSWAVEAIAAKGSVSGRASPAGTAATLAGERKKPSPKAEVKPEAKGGAHQLSADDAAYLSLVQVLVFRRSCGTPIGGNATAAAAAAAGICHTHIPHRDLAASGSAHVGGSASNVMAFAPMTMSAVTNNDALAGLSNAALSNGPLGGMGDMDFDGGGFHFQQFNGHNNGNGNGHGNGHGHGHGRKMQPMPPAPA